MIPALDVEAVQLFIVFVVPGLISMSVYRVLMPARSLEWGQAVLQGMFYSSLNFALLMPLAGWIAQPANAERPALYWLAAMMLLLVFPAVWPLLLRWLFKWSWFASKAQVPYPTAWDYFFDLRRPVFMLVHLKGGRLLGGYCGRSSYAATFPNDGDIYLEAVYSVDAAGKFHGAVADTHGVLLRKEQYDYIELFKVPGVEGR